MALVPTGTELVLPLSACPMCCVTAAGVGAATAPLSFAFPALGAAGGDASGDALVFCAQAVKARAATTRSKRTMRRAPSCAYGWLAAAGPAPTVINRP